MTKAQRLEAIAKLEKEMKEASKMLEFEYAAVLRDQIIELRGGNKRSVCYAAAPRIRMRRESGVQFTIS